MSQQSEPNDFAMIAAVLFCVGFVLLTLFAAVLATVAVLAWLGFSIAYPKESAQYTTWGLLGLLILVAFVVFWSYLYLWDIPVFRAGVISIIALVPAVWGLWLFANVPSNSLLPRFMKMVLLLPLLGGGLYWLLNGGTLVYDVIYCSGALADAKATVIDGVPRLFRDNNYVEAFSAGRNAANICGQAHDIQKTAVFFSLFGVLPLLYLPFGLVHSWDEQRRRFTRDDVVYLFNDIIAESELSLASNSTIETPDWPQIDPDTSMPQRRVAPPFGGR